MLLGKPNIGVTLDAVAIKTGKVLPGAFAGSPRKATVTFAEAYPDDQYTVTFEAVTLTHGYALRAESKTAAGFVINLGSSAIAGLAEILWQAIPVTE